MGKSFHIGRLRPSDIGMSIPPTNIVDNGDIIDDCSIVHIVIADIDAGNMLSGAGNPITCRRAIGAECNADVYTRPDRRPAIVSAVFAPGHPGRSPIVSRHPYPSIRVVIEPVAIVESGPAPAIAGYPCPAVIRIYPMATTAIRPKTRARSRYPYITIVRIADPGVERT